MESQKQHVESEKNAELDSLRGEMEGLRNRVGELEHQKWELEQQKNGELDWVKGELEGAKNRYSKDLCITPFPG